MGGRSEGDSNVLAIIHAPDASTWAVFLQNKLCSDNYKIQSFLHQEPNQNYIANLFSSVQTCAVLVSPMLLEPQYSGFWSRCTDRFNSRTVLLFLGVEQEELRMNVGTYVTDCVPSRQCLVMDGSREAVSGALVRLIEVFESSDSTLHESCASDKDDFEEEKGIYDVPPHPVQQNSVVLIKPEVLYENDSHEVLVLMERKAEGKLIMVTESCYGPSQIILKHVISSAYLATLPNTHVGRVDFRILTEDEHQVGRGWLYVQSTLDQLQSVLEKEASPVTMLCRVLGLSGPSSTQNLDSLLAKRLAFSHFPTGLKNLLNSEDQAPAEHGGQQWPSLLHLAAEFNLTKVCEELLHYPGIIHAACTENCDGLFPCQLAEKNGYTALQKRLVQFVEDMRVRRITADSGIMVETLPPPSAHNAPTPLYINERPPVKYKEDTDDSTDYIDMSKNSYGYKKPRSFSEGCVKTPFAKTPLEASIKEEGSRENLNEPPPLKPKRSQSAASAFLTQASMLGAARRPDSGSSVDSDSQDSQLQQCDVNSRSSTETPQSPLQQCEDSSRSSTETLTHSESGTTTSGSDQKSDEATGRVSWTLDSSTVERPTSQLSSASSQGEYEVPTHPVEADQTVLRTKNKRSKSVQDKISHFLKKIKNPRRQHSSSESDLPTKGQKKYVRQSTASTSSDPLSYRQSTIRSRDPESERDSGAVCDDFNAQVLMRSSNTDSSSRISGKRNGISMQRRVSVRVQHAKNEDLSETPILPSRKSSAETKETFISYMK